MTREQLKQLEADLWSAADRDRLLPRLISGKLSVEILDIHFPPGMAEEMNASPAASVPAAKN